MHANPSFEIRQHTLFSLETRVHLPLSAERYTIAIKCTSIHLAIWLGILLHAAYVCIFLTQCKGQPKRKNEMGLIRQYIEQNMISLNLALQGKNVVSVGYKNSINTGGSGSESHFLPAGITNLRKAERTLCFCSSSMLIPPGFSLQEIVLCYCWLHTHKVLKKADIFLSRNMQNNY